MTRGQANSHRLTLKEFGLMLAMVPVWIIVYALALFWLTVIAGLIGMVVS